jgi:hypothetical protein
MARISPTRSRVGDRSNAGLIDDPAVYRPFVRKVDGYHRVRRALGDLAEHQPSHLDLIPSIENHSGVTQDQRLDVVVVPTSRRFAETREGLAVAITLAHRFQARLLVLCSGEATAREFPAGLLRRTSVPVSVVDMPSQPSGPVLPLPRFESASHVFSVGSWVAQRDVADKRNLALLVAVAHGWKSLLFLDDDVRFLETEDTASSRCFGQDLVAAAVREICAERRDVVGWTMTNFPDNSAVCHARTLVGEPQLQFIGGGSLAVGVSRTIPFFPRIYNEDWLFLYPLLRHRLRRQSRVAEAGVIGQKEYDPFAVGRAASEELGDILAEGMFSVLGRDDIEELIWHRDYWEKVIENRKAMVQEVIKKLDDRSCSLVGNTDVNLAKDAAMSLRKALEVHELAVQKGAGNLADKFVDYLVRWSRDLDRWRRLLRRATPDLVRPTLDRAADGHVWFWGCADLDGFLEPRTCDWFRVTPGTIRVKPEPLKLDVTRSTLALAGKSLQTGG